MSFSAVEDITFTLCFKLFYTTLLDPRIEKKPELSYKPYKKVFSHYYLRSKNIAVSYT
jgi:hypothetical protein